MAFRSMRVREATQLAPQLAMTVVLTVVLTVGVGAGSKARGDEGGERFFENHIRPLFVERCLECHGVDASGGLRLDSRQGLLVGGDSGPAIELDRVSQSLLLQVVRHEGGLEMPPGEKLSAREIELLTEWVRLGAPWPEVEPTREASESASRKHWAFQPVQKVDPPEVKSSGWVKTPVDAFVLSQLEAHQLAPAPEADRRTLIRRVSYALTGLPPRPEEVDAFLQDDDPKAYHQLVERLLASPHFGEHWARLWLDVARYSDTKGYVYAREERFWPHAWVYRDWVVRALNDDLPYDQFLLLQLAADQVPTARREDLAAMGFLTIGRRFLGVKHDIIDDRIDVVTRGTMGLTVSCARCHNHKYDPIPTADYYSLYGVFDSSLEQLVPAGEQPLGDEAFQQELQARREKLREKMAQSRAESSARARARTADYLQAQTELEKYPAEGFDQIFQPDDLLPGFVRRWEAYLHVAERRQDPVFVPWHRYHSLSEEEFSERRDEVTRQLQQELADSVNPMVRERFVEPPRDFQEVVDRYAELFREVDAEWQEVLARREKQRAEQEEQVAEEEQVEQDDPDDLNDPTNLENLEDLGREDAAKQQLLQVLYGPDAPCQVPDEPIVHVETLFDSGTTTALWKLQGDIERWIIQSGEPVPFAVSLIDRPEPVEPRIFRRGNPTQKGPEVPRQFLQVLEGESRQPFQSGSGRLELARAIIDPENPLTPRVMVNRVWTHLFGEGLVATPSDFGLRAEDPSHPELLDWLAATWVEEGWSIKELLRKMVLSATFRQAASWEEWNSTAEPREFWEKGRALDPNNRLLWRMNQHRLTFEEFRDSMLAASGDLETLIGGRAEPLLESPYSRRRTLYGLVDRQFLPSTLRVFDFANPDLHIPRRNETTVPQQALFFLNHPFVLEQARQLAARTTEGSSEEESLRRMFRQVLQREPSSRELAEGRELIREMGTRQEAVIPTTVADWKYGYGPVDEEAERVTGFTELPHFTGDAWQGGPQWPDASLGWVQLTATGGHPGNDRQHAAIRRWTAPETMTIRIETLLQHDAAPGDGVRAFIVSSRSGILRTAQVHQRSVALQVEALEVQQGETIDFVVDIGEILNSDQYLWSVKILRDDEPSSGTTTWDSVTDFTADRTRQLTAWEQLAQVLLCMNEFLFVD